MVYSSSFGYLVTVDLLYADLRDPTPVDTWLAAFSRCSYGLSGLVGAATLAYVPLCLSLGCDFGALVDA